MRRANQLCLAVATDFGENAVGVGNDAVGIGARDENGAVVLVVTFVHGVNDTALAIVVSEFVAGGFAGGFCHVGQAAGHRSFLLTVCRVDGLPSGCRLFIL